MGRDGAGIGRRKPAEVTQHGIGRERDRHPDREGGGGLWREGQQRFVREFHAPAQTDREQQIDGQRLVQRAGDLQVRAQQTCGQTEQEEPDDGIERQAGAP